MAMFVTDATKKKVHEATTTTDAKRVETWLIKKLIKQIISVNV